MNRLVLAMCTLLLIAQQTAMAEGGCPAGMYPIGGGSGGWSGCAPIPGNDGGQAQPAAPSWSSRWGAIAVDGKQGALGGVEGLRSRRKAEKAAIQACQRNGGSACEVLGAYDNQCGALAWGIGKANVFTALNTQEADRGALAECAKGAKDCKIYYSACSYAERIR